MYSTPVSLLLCATYLACATFSFGYEADKASTPTLWKITDKAERVAKDKQRRGSYYADKMKVFLDEEISTGGIVFLGDSLTDRFPLDKTFPNGLHGKKVFNRGIGGDRIEGLLERLDVSVIDLQPSELYVLIGGNDIGYPVDYKDGNLKPGYERLFKALKDVAPQAKIIAFPCVPATSPKHYKTKLIANRQLAEVCKAENIEFIDIFDAFVTPDGVYKHGMNSDSAHMSIAGYLTWMDFFLTPEEKFTAWKDLAKTYQDHEGLVIPISGVNTLRGANSIVIYRKDKDRKTTSTGTNKYGVEALVHDGVVTTVSLRGDMPLPELPDYIISGIGDKRNWMLAHADIGAKVKMSKDEKTITALKEVPKDTFEWNYLLRAMVIADLNKTNDPAIISELKDCFFEIEKIRLGDLSKTKSVLDKLTKIEAKLDKEENK